MQRIGVILKPKKTKMANMYSQITNNIAVDVKPEYSTRRSDPNNRTFVWTYQVVISNRSKISVQLLRRYWKITDANGNTNEVEGEGVVGQQPIIDPGNSFVYTSLCPLETSSGFMQGHYVIQKRGNEVVVNIPAFSLDMPGNPTLVS